MLRRRGIVALPDFVCNAGAVIGYRSAADATPDEVLAAVEAMVTGLIFEALHHPAGPLARACERAGRFLRGWWGEPPGPPYAPEGWPSAAYGRGLSWLFRVFPCTGSTAQPGSTAVMWRQ